MITETHIRDILTHLPQYVTLRTAPTDAQALIAAIQRRDEMMAVLWRESHATQAHYSTYIWSVGSMAWRLTTSHRRINPDDLTEWLVEVLLSNQSAYGPQNLRRYGIAGIVIRMSDKVQRLQALHAHLDTSYAFEEAYDDTLDDLLGYTVLGLHMIGGTA